MSILKFRLVVSYIQVEENQFFSISVAIWILNMIFFYSIFVCDLRSLMPTDRQPPRGAAHK